MNIFILFLLSWSVNAQASELVSLIQNLSTSIQANTVTYYSFEHGAPFTEVVLRTHVPKLLITAAADFELRQNFDWHVLSVVFTADVFNGSLQSTFVKTLTRRHRMDVLFVTESSLGPELVLERWKKFFEWCWEHGFSNVLLTDLAGTLLTYDPFPTLQVKRATLAEYLEQRNNWHDLKGYPIRAAVADTPPRAMIFTDKHGVKQYKGIMPDQFQVFAKVFNAKLVYVPATNYNNYSIRDCYKKLTSGEADICADGTLMDENAPCVVSRPLLLLHGYLTVPFAQPVSKYLVFVVPFHKNLWLLIGVSICYIALITSLMYWRIDGVWRIGELFLASLSSMLLISFNLPSIGGRRQYYMQIILTTTGFIISNLYLALLSSILTTNVFDRQISSIEDVRDRNVTIITNESELRSFQLYGTSDIVFEQVLVLSRKEFREYRDVLDNRFAYINTGDSSDFFLHQQKYMTRPRLKQLEPVSSFWGGTALSKTWQLEDLYNMYLLKLRAYGIRLRIGEETKELGISTGHLKYFETEYYTVVPLGIQYFEMPAILMAAGYGFSVVSFIVEISMQKGRQRIKRLLTNNIGV